MSDEALNAHLDWLDKCAKEQGDIYDALLEKTIAQLKEENAALSELLSHLVDVELERDNLEAENDRLKRDVENMKTAAYHELDRRQKAEAKLTAIECAECGLTMLECKCDET